MRWSSCPSTLARRRPWSSWFAERIRKIARPSPHSSSKPHGPCSVGTVRQMDWTRFAIGPARTGSWGNGSTWWMMIVRRSGWPTTWPMPFGWRRVPRARRLRRKSSACCIPAACTSRRKRSSSNPLGPTWMSGDIRTMSRTTTSYRKTAWHDCRASCVSRRIRSSRPCPIRRCLPAGGSSSSPGISHSTSVKNGR